MRDQNSKFLQKISINKVSHKKSSGNMWKSWLERKSLNVSRYYLWNFWNLWYFKIYVLERPEFVLVVSCLWHLKSSCRYCFGAKHDLGRREVGRCVCAKFVCTSSTSHVRHRGVRQFSVKKKFSVRSYRLIFLTKWQSWLLRITKDRYIW